MHKPKRQRTHPPASSPPRHATPFRSPSRSRSRSRSPGPSHIPATDAHARPPYFAPSRALLASSIPKGLFSSSVASFPTQRYTRSRRNRAHYFLFEKKSLAHSSSSPDTISSLSSSRRPPKRPTAPMLNFVQILTTPTADTPGTCLLVHHDNRRYLFGNVAEGTQRAFVQHKVSLSRAEEIFLTGPITWRTTGGLLGMILTVAEVVQAARGAAIDETAQKAAKLKKAGNNAAAAAAAASAAAAAVAAGPRSLSIHGGTNLTHLLATARRFIFRKGLPIRPHEVRQDTSQAYAQQAGSFRDPDWSDDNIMVWYVPVFVEGDGNGGLSTGGTTSSSRKRAHGNLDDQNGPATAGELEAADRKLVSSVVNHMFDSDWKLDALVETTLHAAKLPAKLFVKDDKGHLKVYDGPLPGQEPDVPDIPVLVRQPWPGALIQALPRTKPARQSMCYIVRNHPRRGKVNAAEAARLGVAKRDIRLLVDGQSVTAADGSTVTPEMVVGASVDGAAFAVAELPDASYVDAFLAKPEWADARIMSAVNTIFWLLGPGVVADERLQAFMQKHSAIRHTVSSTDTCANRLALSSAAALQVKHNRVDPDRFPIQKYDNIVPAPVVATTANLSTPTTSTTTTTTTTPSPPLFEAARSGWTVRLAPQVIEEDQKVYPYVDFAQALREMDPRVLELADSARTQIAEPAFHAAVAAANRGLPHPEAEVIPLGTGSAMPSKYRNVSATLVRVPGVGSYLFDCGENTLGSMRRLLGDAKLDEVLKELRVLWISHLHADHHLGTVSVIRAWRDATATITTGEETKRATPRLMVASHVNMLHWLREYADVEDFGLDRLYQVELDCPDFPRTRTCTPVVLDGAEAAEFGLQRIDACRVEHCHGALATVFTWQTEDSSSSPLSSSAESPLKIAYSGDCRPSADFVEIGRGATLLLHESTFDDELAGEALAKKHSTMGEALAIGRQMGARRVLLTHFSQRYPKIPVFNSGSNSGGSENGDMQVLVAFDQMRVRLGDFQTAAAFLPALQKLYEGEEKQ